MHLKDIDFTTAVCYTGNKTRKHLLTKELARIGINDPHIIWSFDTPYRNFLLSKIPHIPELNTHPGYWGATLSHYSALKISYALGASSALIVEDDCRFLKDVNQIEAHLSIVPEDWDMLMLDSFGRKNEKDTSVQGWHTCDSTFSTAGYIVNRRAMEKLIDLYESPVSGRYHKPMMRNSDHWANVKYLGTNIKFYCASPNLCIQCLWGGDTNTGTNYIEKQYKGMGISIDDYSSFEEL